MKMTVVLDTNVLVSGLRPAKNAPGRIIDLLEQGRLQLVLDDSIWREYGEVLARPELTPYFSVSRRDAVLDCIRENAQFISVSNSIEGLPDADDACFLEVAVETGAPLITGNIKHFPVKLRHGARVFTPAEFLQEFIHE